MEIKKYETHEYGEIFHTPYHVFNKINFNKLNSERRNIEIECLAFKTKKHKLGIIGGIEDKKFRSSFSAPFGGFSFAQKGVGLETIDECVELLINYYEIDLVNEIEITLPPLFYEQNFISKVNNSLYRKGFTLLKNDLNFSIKLEGSVDDYIKTLEYNAKKNLNIALTKNFRFIECETAEEKELSYEIIKVNRETKGYALRMSYEAITETIQLIEADFFLVKLEETAIASAMIFYVAEGIVQVIYWGDLPGYGDNKTMNYLSYSLIAHYYNKNIKIIDIGPSSENSIPNYGLCDFKESIGCDIYPKITWNLKR